MNFLYITTDDIVRNASCNIRNVSLIKGLIAKGHQVQILCMHHGKGQDKQLVHALDGISVFYLNDNNVVTQVPKEKKEQKKSRLKGMLLRLYNRVRVIDSYMYYINESDIKRVLPKLTTPDVVLSSSDPRSSHILAGKIIQHFQKSKWVQYWGDPMANDISSAAIVKPFIRYRERQILEKADLIVYTNNLTAEIIKSSYPTVKAPIISIPTSNILLSNSDNKIEKCYDKSITRIGYFGSFIKQQRNVKPLIETVLNHESIDLTLVGNTDVVINESDRVHVFPFVGLTELNQLQDSMDILLVIENIPSDNKKENCVQIPGKVFHYGLSDKPILVISETGITEKEFSKYDKYIFCENEMNQIWKAIEFINNNDSRFAHPIDDFKPENVATMLIDKIVDTISK